MKQQVPTLAFVIDDEANWPKTKMDSETLKIQALKLFKEKVKEKYTGIWKAADDLHGKVAISLMKEISVNPRVGWIRTSEISSPPEAMNELTRLSKENSESLKD